MNRGIKSKLEYYVPNREFATGFIKEFNEKLIEKLHKNYKADFSVPLPLLSRHDKVTAEKLIGQLVRYYQLPYTFGVVGVKSFDMFCCEEVKFYKEVS